MASLGVTRYRIETTFSPLVADSFWHFRGDFWACPRFGWCGGLCAASTDGWPRAGWRGSTRRSSQSAALGLGASPTSTAPRSSGH